MVLGSSPVAVSIIYMAFLNQKIWVISQPAFNSSKSTMETPEQSVKPVSN